MTIGPLANFKQPGQLTNASIQAFLMFYATLKLKRYKATIPLVQTLKLLEKQSIKLGNMKHVNFVPKNVQKKILWASSRLS